MKKKRITLADIALETGLSRSGVSLALRNDPTIPVKTRERVQKIALDMGHRPNPELNAYLQALRHSREHESAPTIGYLTFHGEFSDGFGSDYSKNLFLGCQKRAETLGYKFERLRVGINGMTQKRIGQIINARSIKGLLVSPSASEGELLSLDLAKVAVVLLTYRHPDLGFCRAVPAVFSNLELAYRHLFDLGYARIGLMVSDVIKFRPNSYIQAAYLNMQECNPKAAAMPVFRNSASYSDSVAEPGPDVITALQRWLRKAKPDVILGCWESYHSWLIGAGADSIPFVSLEGNESGHASFYIDQQPNEIGLAGVDVIDYLLTRNKYGYMKCPLISRIKGTWVEVQK
jgi:LacI family transcriptional regulator